MIFFGKIMLMSLILIAFSSYSANASIVSYGSEGIIANNSTLLIASTAENVKNVVVTSPIVINTQITWPVDRELTFERGGYITFVGKGSLKGLKYARPEWFGDNPVPGLTDMTGAIQSAINASSVVIFTGTYKTSRVVLPDRNIKLIGIGAKLYGYKGDIFYQSNRGVLTEMDGLSFTGSAIAFNREGNDGVQSSPHSNQFKEYNISNCNFSMDSNVYGIRLFRAREGFISNCYFGGGVRFGNGLYSELSIGVEIQNCMFDNCHYAVYSAVGSEGLKILGGVMIGNHVGLYTFQTYGVQIIGGMFDYNDKSFLFENSSAILINGTYISSRSVSPAVHVKQRAGINIRNNNITISNCPVITQNSTDVNNVVVAIEQADFVRIVSNTITGFKKNGIEYSNSKFITIRDNYIHSKLGYGKYSIYEEDKFGTNSSKILYNYTDKPMYVPNAAETVGNWLNY